MLSRDQRTQDLALIRIQAILAPYTRIKEEIERIKTTIGPSQRAEEINKLRQSLLNLADSNKRRATLPLIKASLHLLARYWPLYDKCAVSDAELTEETSITTTSGYFISKAVLPTLLTQRKILNPKTQQPFRRDDLSYFLSIAERENLIVKDAATPVAIVGLVLGALLTIALAVGFCMGIPFLAPALVPTLCVLGVALVLGILSYPEGLILPLALVSLPSIIAGGLGFVIGSLINYFKRRPAFIRPDSNERIAHNIFLIKEQLKERQIQEGQEEKEVPHLILNLTNKEQLFLILADPILSAAYKLKLLKDHKDDIKTYIVRNELLHYFMKKTEDFRENNRPVYKELLAINLSAYRELRNTQPEYLHWYGQFFGYDRTAKVKSADQVILALENNQKIQPLFEDEHHEGPLNTGNLGIITKRLAKTQGGPQFFTCAHCNSRVSSETYDRNEQQSMRSNRNHGHAHD